MNMNIEKFVNEILVKKYGLREELGKDLQFLLIAKGLFNNSCVFGEREITIENANHLQMVSFTPEGNMVVKSTYVSAWGTCQTLSDRDIVVREATYSTLHSVMKEQIKEVFVRRADMVSKKLNGHLVATLNMYCEGIQESSYRMMSGVQEINPETDIMSQFPMEGNRMIDIIDQLKKDDNDEARKLLKANNLTDCSHIQRSTEYLELFEYKSWYLRDELVTHEETYRIASVSELHQIDRGSVSNEDQPLDARELRYLLLAIIGEAETSMAAEYLLENEILVKIFLEATKHVRDRVDLRDYIKNLSKRMVDTKIDRILIDSEYIYDIKDGRLIKVGVQPKALLELLYS